ncbi:hypothetical protein NDN08_004491 [Rhodosorus marinus]|uniref:Condensin complex subunit 1 n=1 Tax=Rhodosorus marinus TaxID=101924 RepID=A0AAV8UQM3_9RHOD|nr:hypothetical protein NDN08_004491 [Rhodosorus marinus]
MVENGDLDADAYEGVDYVVLNDDVLTSVYNASTVLAEGNDLERLAVLFQFPQFLEHCPADTINIMIPEICSNVTGWTENATMASAEALYFVIGVAIPDDIASAILDVSLKILDKMGQGDIFDAWGEILSMIVAQVSSNDVHSKLIPMTIERLGSKTIDSRRLAARLIGSLADVLSSEEVEDLFLKRVVDLCDDKDSSVRAMIAQSLASVGAKLPLKLCEEHLSPKLCFLTEDDSARVRAAAVRAVAKIGDAHKAEATNSNMFKTLLLSMFIEKCKDATITAATDLRTVDDDTYVMLEIFAEVYGYFLIALNPLFEDEETWTLTLNGLRRMVSCNGPTVRHWCAFNLPAVATCCGADRPDRIKGVLHALSTDTDVETRATLAAGIHETARVVGDTDLRGEVLVAVGELMTDQNPQVRLNALTNFAELLELLSEKEPAARKLDPVFTNLEALAQDSWRTQKVLAEQLDKAACNIPQEMLCEYVAPVLFQMARESTYLVRNASIAAAVRVLRYISAIRRRDGIHNHFINEWAQGKVYWTRLAFLEGADVARTIFSRKLYNSMFAESALKMSGDSVSNVRLRLVNLMQNSIAESKDLKLYSEALAKLVEDSDPEVKEAALSCQEAVAGFKGLSPEQVKEDKQREEAEDKFFVLPKAQVSKGASQKPVVLSTRTSSKKQFVKSQPPLKPPVPSDVVLSKFSTGDPEGMAEGNDLNSANGVRGEKDEEETLDKRKGLLRRACCSVS